MPPSLQSSLLPAASQVELIQSLIGLGVCLAMSFLLRAFYLRRSLSLTGKHHIGSIIPLLSAVVFLVIVVVKTSLALSLGMVGALSIVRFRTPVKEPEELVYLFLAIALGIGYGSGHLLLTTATTSIILIVAYMFLSSTKRGPGEYNLLLNWTSDSNSFDDIMTILEDYFESAKLVRMEDGGRDISAVLLIEPAGDFSFGKLTGSLRQICPGLTATFFEAKTTW
jgi:hypothetical protein